jgi:hypothetical protein
MLGIRPSQHSNIFAEEGGRALRSAIDEGHIAKIDTCKYINRRAMNKKTKRKKQK